jgi:hypothetical protein
MFKHQKHSDFFWLAISFSMISLLFAIALEFTLLLGIYLAQASFYLLCGGAIISLLVGLTFSFLNIIS